MKNPQAARFLFALAIALICSNCTGPQEPFFHYNSPFGKKGLVGYERPEKHDTRIADEEFDTPSDFENQPTPSLAPEDTRKPELSNSLANNANNANNAANTANTSTQADPPPAPEIYVHKRGPAGSICYTCRGKGYVFQPTTSYSGDNHVCPACDGDGHY